jgi:hypothetical protein
MPTNMLQSIIDRYQDDEFLIADGFDEAVIGYDETQMRLIYSVAKFIEILEREMSSEDAMEHFTFNVSGGDVGKQTPIWCWDTF